MMMRLKQNKMMWSLVSRLFALLFLAACDLNVPKDYALPNSVDETTANQEIRCSNYSFEVDTSNPSGENDFRVLCEGVTAYSTLNDFAGDFSFIKVDRNGIQNITEARSLAKAIQVKNVGNDIDHDGIAEVVLVSDSDSRVGPRHTILLLGPVFRRLEYRDYDETLFTDIDENGSLEILTRDYGVTNGVGESDGWPTNLEPPRVVLSVHGGSFTFSEKVREQFDLKRFKSMTNRASNKITADEDIPDEVGSYMLELIYQGEGQRAFEFFDRVTAVLDDDTKSMYENWITLTLINSATFFEPVMAFNGWKYTQLEGESACPEGADRDRFVLSEKVTLTRELGVF